MAVGLAAVVAVVVTTVVVGATRVVVAAAAVVVAAVNLEPTGVVTLVSALTPATVAFSRGSLTSTTPDKDKLARFPACTFS